MTPRMLHRIEGLDYRHARGADNRRVILSRIALARDALD